MIIFIGIHRTTKQNNFSANRLGFEIKCLKKNIVFVEINFFSMATLLELFFTKY